MAVLQGDVMVATDPVSTWGGRAHFSDVTLAWMDDTGWYESSSDSRGKLRWGRNAGCSFLTGACNHGQGVTCCATANELCV